MQLEISKEELNQLPIFRYSGKIQILSGKKAAEGIKKQLIHEPVLGVDTETKPVFKKGGFHPVALLQIATRKSVFIFRLQKTGIPSYLVDLLEDPEIIKAGIDLGRDIQELGQYAEINAKSVIDLNNMAKELGFISV
ncbi:3'-5' exonuclease domain-containing protein 2, partial [Bacteroidota bacterium]